MKTKIRKWGNSAAIRLPKHILVAIGTELGAQVTLRVKGSQLILEPVMSLEALLDAITPENLHGEIETGPPIGKEIG